MIRKTTFILIAVLVIATGASTLLVRFYPKDNILYNTVNIDNIDREFYYYIPKQISAHPRLLFVLHGGNMQAQDMQTITGRQFNQLADKYNDMIIVYPQGYDRRWNDCRIANDYYPKTKHLNDVDFFEKMVTYFSSKYNINGSSIYVMGFGAGGQMCLKLAKEKPGLFKGFAAICSNMPAQTNNDCYETQQPVSILFMNGTTDPYVPYNGGKMVSPKGQDLGTVLSTTESVAYWVNLAKGDTGISAEYTYPTTVPQPNTSVRQYYYPCNKTGKRVMLVKIENGGHVFPNPTYNLWTKAMGLATPDINAAETIVDFLRNL